MQIITRKTAVLIATCCYAGALLAGANDDTCKAAQRFGENLGTAFQIRDDIIDFLPSQHTGKPQGNDITEQKCTLPLILALKDTHTRRLLMPLLQDNTHSDRDIATIIALVSDGGYLDNAADTMRTYLDRAAQELTALPDNTYRNSLNNIIGFLKEI